MYESQMRLANFPEAGPREARKGHSKARVWGKTRSIKWPQAKQLFVEASLLEETPHTWILWFKTSGILLATTSRTGL